MFKKNVSSGKINKPKDSPYMYLNEMATEAKDIREVIGD
jgi:hypothetical protein